METMKRLGRGFKKMGDKVVDISKKWIEDQRKENERKRKIYDQAFRKAEKDEIKKKAMKDAMDRYGKKRKFLEI